MTYVIVHCITPLQSLVSEDCHSGHWPLPKCHCLSDDRCRSVWSLAQASVSSLGLSTATMGDSLKQREGCSPKVFRKFSQIFRVSTGHLSTPIDSQIPEGWYGRTKADPVLEPQFFSCWAIIRSYLPYRDLIGFFLPLQGPKQITTHWEESGAGQQVNAGIC